MQKASALILFVCFAAAVQSQIVIAPSDINFGDVQIGQSVTKTVYIINVGDEPTTMSGVGGGLDVPFDTVQNCQDNVLAPGESCDMSFTFTPTEQGSVTTLSQGTWNDVAFDISIKANVVGAQASIAPIDDESQLNIAPTQIDFGTVAIGSSAEKIVYVTNVSNEPVVLSGTAGGLEGPNFFLAESCENTTLAPGDSCQMTITFTSTTFGKASDVATGTWNNQKFFIYVSGTEF